MFCKKCGTQLHPEARFCKKCGTPVVATTPMNPVPPIEPPRNETPGSQSGDSPARKSEAIAPPEIPIPPPVAPPPMPPEIPMPPPIAPPLRRETVAIEAAPTLPPRAVPPTPEPTPAPPIKQSVVAPRVTPPSGPVMSPPAVLTEPRPEAAKSPAIEDGLQSSSEKLPLTELPEEERSGNRRWLLVALAAVLLAAGGGAWWMWGGSKAAPQAGKASAAVSAPAPPEGMVYVPGGELMMGNDAGAVQERPAHKVTVTPFFIDRNEVTCEQYARFVAATGHRAPPAWAGGRFPEGAASRPVTGVDWDDANDYAAWAGKRLPTEQEWEFAARGADGRRYPWGSEWKNDAANAHTSNAGNMVNVGAHPSGASPFGANDMVGNAWEWTASDYVPYPGGELPAPNLAGPLKVIRGGCYDSDQNYATTTFRVGWPARGHDEYNNTGFRCAKDLLSTASAGTNRPTAAATPATVADNALAGIIRNNDAVQGCGCYFNLATENNPRSTRYVFLGSLEGKQDAWMNLDGKDIRLRLAHSIEPQGKIKIGSRSASQYVAVGDIVVNVEKVVTRICPPGDEACEVTDYEANINITKGNRTQTIKAKGGCGC